MATYRHWSVSLWRDPDDVPHCWILSSDKTEWLISATLCRWRRCFVADHLYLMKCIREEEVHWAWWDWPSTWLTTHCPSVLWHCWLSHVTRKIVSEMTYNVSSGTLNSTRPYHTLLCLTQLATIFIDWYHCQSLLLVMCSTTCWWGRWTGSSRCHTLEVLLLSTTRADCLRLAHSEARLAGSHQSSVCTAWCTTGQCHWYQECRVPTSISDYRVPASTCDTGFLLVIDSCELFPNCSRFRSLMQPWELLIRLICYWYL